MGNIETSFVGGAYTARSKNLNAQACQNFYVETDQTGAKNIIALVGSPGAKPWADMAVAAEGRKFHEFQSRLYEVLGDTVYKLDTNRVKTAIGTIGTSEGWVDIVSDATYMVVFDTTGGWTWDGATFTAISAAGFPANLSGATYQDGYFIVSSAGTDQFFISGLDDPTSWSALDFATAEGDADELVSPVSVQRQLWLIGTDTTEIWYNSGETFPFRRNPGGFTRVGSNAKRSIVAHSPDKGEDELMFLDDRNRVVRRQGFRVVPVSTYQIDFLISTMASTSDSVANIYNQEGHTFYELTFPTDSKTICYDLTTGFWSTRASGAGDLRSPANAITRFEDQILIAHYDNGKIHEYDLATYDDDGDVKRAIRVAQVVDNNNQMMYISSFELEMETGFGGNIMFQSSKDGGHTWSPERWKSMGAVGEYDTRVRWNRHGKARNFSPQIIIADDVKRNITKAHLRGTVSDV